MHSAAFPGRRSTVPVLLSLLYGGVLASTITSVPNAIPTSISSTQTCEFRTINYITDTLPQQCLRSTWSNPNGTTSTRAAETGETTSDGIMTSLSPTVSASDSIDVRNATITETAAEQATTSSSISSPVPTESQEVSQDELESEELNDAAFLSFEEWRKQTLAKAGQENANIGGKKAKDGKRRDSEGIQNHLDSLGDEGEIDLDFGAFKTGGAADEVHADSRGKDEGSEEYPKDGEGKKKKDQYRSKDAGKTCKERFSYASFDAGATVLKTHPGAKNPKAILIENKDSYMLSECKTKNKFVIIELSEDIWIDTLVLANHEFFSSMVRSFKVSVSDRYPIKMDKWKDAGTYEARNSREIQAFLIENPQIWARYIRIEFLTHYGKEYYCPLSLVRVHGTRMLESWKESEANNEEDDEGDSNEEPNSEEQLVPEAVADAVKEEEKLQAELKEAQAAIENLVHEAQEISATLTDQQIPINASQLGEANASLEHVVEEQMSTPWVSDFDFGAWMNVSQGLDMCLPKESPSQTTVTSANITQTVTSITGPCAESVSTSVLHVANDTAHTMTATPVANSTGSSTVAAETISSTETASPTIESTTSVPTIISSAVSSVAKLQNATSSIKSKMSSTTTSSHSLPTQQESFFKAVSRRLQLLEANSTMSLKYIEDQSRALRDAFSRVEKKQLSKTTTFLNTLNSTVFTELKEIRQQYDEIWQSTVISLESQREENRKEILAISSRLNILADEVVFQKRMSIVQSVLLLLCLGLVIFSRMSPSLLPLSNRSRYFDSYAVESPIISPPGSPEYELPGDVLPNGEQSWLNGYRRLQSRDSSLSIEYEGEVGEEYEDEVYEDEVQDEPVSPPTPTSLCSRSSYSGTPPSKEHSSSPSDFYRSSPLKRSISAQHAPTYEQYPNNNGLNNNLPPIPARTSSFKDGKDLSLTSSRSRSKSESLHDSGSGVHETSPSPHRTPKKRNSVKRQQFNSTFHDNDPTTPTRIGFTNSPRLQNMDISPPAANGNGSGHIPIINTTPASPPQIQRNGGGGGGGGGRNRHTSSGSFSIARKPLPALPNEMENDDEKT